MTGDDVFDSLTVSIQAIAEIITRYRTMRNALLEILDEAESDCDRDIIITAAKDALEAAND